MSVYTTVTEAELAAWLRAYPVGMLVALQPIAKGIENSNFFVTTTQGRYVLTLFERLAPEELPFYLELMSHLARHGIPCPAPIADRNGALLSSLNGKPAALVTRLPGVSVEAPSAAHCASLGALLARMHLAGRGFAGGLENPRGPKWWRLAARDVRPFLNAAQVNRLEEELRFQSLYRLPDLPRGPVHADLFRDNALFEFMRHDITWPLYVEVDRIYNLACPASPVHYQFDPVQTTKTSVHGAINMLGLAKRLKVRILQASTSEVYGDPADQQAIAALSAVSGERSVVPINCRTPIEEFGSLHCLTMQLPEGALANA